MRFYHAITSACENVYPEIHWQRGGGISFYASARSDQSLHCPLTESWMLQNVWLESKNQDDTVRNGDGETNRTGNSNDSVQYFDG